MATFKKIYRYSADEAPEGTCIYILKDDAGWLYLKVLVESEGLTTPFKSVVEIESYIGMKLTMIDESDFDSLRP